MTKRTYEETFIENHKFRIITTSENDKEIGAYKCECSVIIKNTSNIPKHLQTKSHYTNLEWKRQNIPPVSLLRPDLKPK